MPSSEPYYNLSGASPQEKHSDNLSSFESAVEARATSLRIAVETRVQYADIQKKLYRWLEDLFEDYIGRISSRDADYIARLSKDWVKETITIFGNIFEPIVYDHADDDTTFEIFAGTMEHIETMTDGFIKDINHKILEGELPIITKKTSAQTSRTIESFVVNKAHSKEIIELLHPIVDGLSGKEVAVFVKAAVEYNILLPEINFDYLDKVFTITKRSTYYYHADYKLTESDREHFKELFAPILALC